MKAVLVIELPDVEEVHHPTLETFRQQLMSETDMPVHAVAGADAEMVLDVFKAPMSGGGRHVAKISDTGWALEHSLICRRAGLLNCSITRLVGVGWDEGHLEDGEHRVWLDEAGVLLWEDA